MVAELGGVMILSAMVLEGEVAVSKGIFTYLYKPTSRSACPFNVVILTEEK
jgi:hypothetical protein